MDKAKEFKMLGNTHFGNGDYSSALGSFTSAITYCPIESTEELAIFYNNRGLAYLKLEKEEDAMEDFTRAIELNERYVKPRF